MTVYKASNSSTTMYRDKKTSGVIYQTKKWQIFKNEEKND